MDRSFIEALITKHEGRRNKVYDDTLGILTIGIGWNLEDSQSQDVCDHFGLNLADLKSGQEVLTDQQIDEVFDYHVTRSISDAASLIPTLMTMPDKKSAAIVDMIFQLGLPRFSKFHDTINAINKGDWEDAAACALDSIWAKQTPTRAADDTSLFLSPETQ